MNVNSTPANPPSTIGNVWLDGSSIIGPSYQTISTNSIEFQRMDERLKAIEEQLLILQRDKVMEEKYPALKEAYEAYIVILKLVRSNNE